MLYPWGIFITMIKQLKNMSPTQVSLASLLADVHVGYPHLTKEYF